MASTFYIPYVVAASAGSTDGQTGLFVVPSNNLTATPVSVASGNISSIGATFQVALSKGSLSSFAIESIMYGVEDTSGNVKLYGMNLTSTGTPQATQISNLDVPLATSNPAPKGSLCPNFNEAQTDATDPTSMFVLLDLAGSNGCGSSDDTYEVVHFTDSASTAPTEVMVGTLSFDPVYASDGTLGGLIVLEGSNLDFYAGGDLTSTPTTLLSNVAKVSSLYSITSVLEGNVPGATFEVVTPSSGQEAVYRIDSAGNAVKVYTALGAQDTLGVGTSDDNYVYFTDTAPGATTESIEEVPLAGGSPITLFSPPSGSTLEGSNDSVLFYVNGDGLYSVPVGNSTTTATQVDTFSGSVDAILTGPPGDLPDSVLLVNITAQNGTTTTLSSCVLAADGTQLVPVTAQSEWLKTNQDGYALQVSGITSTDGSEGGGSVVAYDIASNTLATSPFTVPGGGAYQIPAGDTLNVLYLSDSIGSGQLTDFSTGTPAGAIAFDQSQSIVEPITVKDSLVVAY